MNDAWKNDLSQPALRLVTDRPRGWELLLFSQALADALGKHQGLKRDAELGISFAAPRRVEPKDILVTLETAMDGITRIVSGLATLVNTALPSALEPPGVEADPAAICHVADRIGDAYRAALEWTLRLREISTDPEWEKLPMIVSGFTRNMFREIEEFSELCRREIPEALRATEGPDAPVVELKLKCTLTTPESPEFYAELQRLAGHLGFDASLS